ncbi:monovalent cation:proton antiporter family protein [Rossellomorea oryzaecorticis]|uniref:Monovalent cation:proton antiporter family protein n=1 Tax=Rossellomorea oryzaecorticis TaxID=1396505 RepID=A0ABW8VLX4_9BACI|nr:monovalent cation:proton antiporter family protein [[Bacillus] enclensis]MBH9966360.1 monovalent cation:proton antiporter family protein [[Bacillus] enclensis]QTC42136.1 monovalent cation:proton antiporter family protein [Bacillus sp. V3]QWC24890.1 monovalent cation:proton antiporter family protein [Bacillus haikouensis]
MEQHASVTSLVIVIIVAFLTPILLHRFKLNFIPVVIAEIIMGLVIGKSGFNLVQQDMWLETLSTFGFIFLMFLSGLEIDFKAFSNSKTKKEILPSGKEEPNRLLVASIIFIGIFFVSLGLSYLFVLFGLIENAFLMTLIISTISLGVVVPTLKEAQISKTAIGQIILLIAVIADLVTMILLAVFVSLYGEGHGSMWLLLVLFGVGVLLYLLGKRMKNNNFIKSLSTGTVQIGTRAVFTLIILLVAVSETVGAENILGAFLAGVLVSLLAPNQEMVQKLDSFGYGFLIPIFFVMVGVELDLMTLLSDKKMLLLIPLLLLAFLISKLLPVYLLKKWYDTKTTIASAFLLTSTLSLVIAAAKIAERMEIITPQMSGTLILVAVIACIITPIVFKKLFPRESATEKKLNVVFLGANQMTLPASRELQSSLYDSTLYHTIQDKSDKNIADSLFNINEIENYELDTLDGLGIFEADILVISTGDEEANATLSVAAKERGVERVIVRVESPDLHESLKEQEIEVYSVFLSTKALLRAMIESPSVMNILTNQEMSLYEIKMLNSQFEGMTLRKFPFTGDVIFVRIFRGKDSIVPHGDTELHMNDRLIVTGSKEYVDELKRELEFCEYC